MPDQAGPLMTADEFLEWIQHQERRHELVDGVPVPMTSAKRRHDRVVVNATIALGNRLGVGPCQPFSADTAVRIPKGNIRYPDAGVDCGVFRDETNWADAPTLVIEVLSDSTRLFDFTRKLEEYKTVPSLRHILFVDLDSPEIIHWRRDPGTAWESETIGGLDAVIAIPDLDLDLPLATLYAGLEFRPEPRLVYPE